MPGAPPSARTTRPESSAIAGSPLAPAAAFAFSAAFASKLSPVSSGSAMPSAPAETAWIAKGASSADISSTLPWLWLAMTSRSPVLDLDYAEDSQAETDANFVLTGTGGIVEIQATAEGAPFDEALFAEMLRLARAGIAELTRHQRATLGLG